LKPVRDQIVDWILLEAPSMPSDRFGEILIGFLEQMLEMAARPAELNRWNERWFEAHELFVYETFLYTVAALLKVGAWEVLHDVLTTHYLAPEASRHRGAGFDNFRAFSATAGSLQGVISPPDKRLLSPAAALIKEHANRTDLPFESIMQADLLVLLMACVTSVRWSPQTLVYASGGQAFPFFVRAAQNRGFEKLARITGISDANKLRAVIDAGLGDADKSHHFWLRDVSFRTLMNAANIDTIK
jgi:hypothetical protein